MSQSSDTDRDPYPPLDFNHPSHAWWLERPVEDLAIQRKLIEEAELVILRLLWLTAPDAIDFVSIVKSTEAAFQQSDIMAAKAVQSLEKQGLIEQGPNHIEPEYRLSRKGYERARELRPSKTDASFLPDDMKAGTGRRSPVGVGMSRDEASKLAWELLWTDADFFKKSAKEWAKAIGCSERTVYKLPAWKEAMRRRKTKTSRKTTIPRRAFGGMETLERQGKPDDSADVQDTIKRIKTDPRMTAEGLKAIENMTPEERRDLAEAYESQQADWELDPKEPDLQSDPSDSPEERRKKARLRRPRAPHQV